MQENLIMSPSLATFKTKYKKLYFKCPPTNYNFGNRIPNIFHTRFRVNFTTLRGDLYLRSLVDSPTCSCGRECESYSHYFLRCPRYTHARQLLYNDLDVLAVQCGLNIRDLNEDILINHLLYGFEFEFKRFNRTLFLAIQKYILLTDRF